MSLHFHSLFIKQIRRETSDCVSIAFDIPDQLKNTFQYQAGQYLTVRKIINGEEIRRSYSLCSSPLQNEWRIAIKKNTGGVFSTYANETLKSGEYIDVMPPVGKFTTTILSSHQKNYLAIAAGSGITPVFSIIQNILEGEPDSHLTLVYGNKNRSSIIFKEALDALKNKYIDRFQLIHILSREKTDAALHYGRIDDEKLQGLIKLIGLKQIDEFFICGPEQMIHNTKTFLITQHIDAKKIHIELFASKKRESLVVNRELKAIDDSPKSKITVKLDGVSFDFDLAFNSNSILDAALQEGADLPYACKGGVCCTCKAKLIEGKVRMDVNYSLEPEEIEAGYILTCQSHPTTEIVVVDYDVK